MPKRISKPGPGQTEFDFNNGLPPRERRAQPAEQLPAAQRSAVQPSLFEDEMRPEHAEVHEAPPLRPPEYPPEIAEHFRQLELYNTAFKGKRAPNGEQRKRLLGLIKSGVHKDAKHMIPLDASPIHLAFVLEIPHKAVKEFLAATAHGGKARHEEGPLYDHLRALTPDKVRAAVARYRRAMDARPE